MKRLLAAVCTIVITATAAGAAAAQNIVITNARILDGKGGVIERGTIVARNGRIAAVTAGAPGAIPAGVQRLDAQGMTVMPGFIDAHRHIISGIKPDAFLADAPARMRPYLEAGFTTVYSMLDDPKAILELRRRLQTGQVLGPRIFAVAVAPLNRPAAPPPGAAPPAGPPGVDPARTDTSRNGDRPTALAIPDEALRDIVRKAKADGFDGIKTFMIKTRNGPETHALSVITEEARKQGLRTFTHAVTVEDALAAVEGRTDTLAHSPHIGQLDTNPGAVRTIAASRIPMVSTLGVFIPYFDQHDAPLFRDSGPFPWETLASGGQGPVNARLLWQAGVTYGYGTDTSWSPRDSLRTELRPLSVMFSPREIVRIIGINAAVAIGKQNDLGSLERGKIADMVILRADPLADIDNLLQVAAVVKDGKLVIDKRTPARRTPARRR